MTGPEHYREAERLLDQVVPNGDTDGQVVMHLRAQVHATLALAAATANRVNDAGDSLATAPEEFDYKHPNGGNLTWESAVS